MDTDKIHPLVHNEPAGGTSSGPAGAHLTDEQFTDLLLGAADLSAAEHLALCLQCAEEAGRFTSAVGSFERESRLWAERRASTQSLPARSRQAGFPWLRHPAVWPAAAAALILAATLSVTHRASAPAPQAALSQAAAGAAPVAAASLRSDNQLLSAIDGELNSGSDSDAAQLASYGLTTPVHSGRARGSRRISD